MAITIYRYPHENIDNFLRRFKRKIKDEKFNIEIRKKEYYIKPSEKRRQKKKEAILRQKYGNNSNNSL